MFFIHLFNIGQVQVHLDLTQNELNQKPENQNKKKNKGKKNTHIHTCLHYVRCEKTTTSFFPHFHALRRSGRLLRFFGTNFRRLKPHFLKVLSTPPSEALLNKWVANTTTKYYFDSFLVINTLLRIVNSKNINFSLLRRKNLSFFHNILRLFGALGCNLTQGWHACDKP